MEIAPCYTAMWQQPLPFHPSLLSASQNSAPGHVNFPRQPSEGIVLSQTRIRLPYPSVLANCFLAALYSFILRIFYYLIHTSLSPIVNSCNLQRIAHVCLLRHFDRETTRSQSSPDSLFHSLAQPSLQKLHSLSLSHGRKSISRR